MFIKMTSLIFLTDLRLFKLPVLLPPKLNAHLFLPALGFELGVLGALIVFDLEALVIIEKRKILIPKFDLEKIQGLSFRKPVSECFYDF